MVSMAAMKLLFICTTERSSTMKLSIINTSCTRPSTAAMPLFRSKRMAMYASISTLAISTDMKALYSSVWPATGPT